MLAVSGFQQTLNLFGLKDNKGKPFAVDGIIGQNTSAALKQNGFNNIFDFIDVVKGVQKALGLKDDGIVGNNTLAAFQQNGINSFDKLKNFARVKASRENWAQNQVSQANLTMPTPQLNAPQTGGLMHENKKIKVSENELKKLIKESVKTILMGYKK
jgi:lysozyme family protein